MKPKHIKEQRLKLVRQNWKKSRELWEAEKALGYKKLEPPIRHGWFKEIVIVRKIERYRNKEAIIELYEKLHNSFWGRTKEDADKVWLRSTSEYLIHKGLPTISRRQYNKLSFKAQCLCTPFKYLTYRKKWKLRFYVRIPKGAYRIKYTRAYITHSKQIDPVIKSASALLEQQLLKPGVYEADKRLDPYKYKYYSMKPVICRGKVKAELKQLKSYAMDRLLQDELSLKTINH